MAHKTFAEIRQKNQKTFDLFTLNVFNAIEIHTAQISGRKWPVKQGLIYKPSFWFGKVGRQTNIGLQISLLQISLLLLRLCFLRCQHTYQHHLPQNSLLFQHMLLRLAHHQENVESVLNCM